MSDPKEIKKKFEKLYAEWEKITQDPKIQFSSRPQDYTDNKPYKEMIKLGKDALPLILEKINKGVFFLNEAALKVSKVEFDKILENENKLALAEKADFLAEAEEPPRFLSEQQKAQLILKHLAK